MRYLIIPALVSAILLYSYSLTDPQPDFQLWKLQHSKFYDTELEQRYRRYVFLQNVQLIRAHNSNPSRTWDMGLTKFSDLTQQEFARKYLMNHIDYNVSAHVDNRTQVGINIDWVNAGKVTRVKDQGEECLASYAFGATGAMESAHMISSGGSEEYSEQQLIDCSKGGANNGCHGGFIGTCFQYAKNHGISYQNDYPYHGIQDKCKKDGGSRKIKSYTAIGDCIALQNALNKKPVGVMVDGSNWMHYKGGIFNQCGHALNQGALLVGATDFYWKVKNSWGTKWGENGYIRLTPGTTCGICLHAAYPDW